MDYERRYPSASTKGIRHVISSSMQKMGEMNGPL
jgi:hypothetical protein